MKTVFPTKNKTSHFHWLWITLLGAPQLWAQEAPQDSLQQKVIEPVLISSIRADKNTPVTFTNLNKEDIKARNLGQDIPSLLQFMPSVVMTSDTGNGIGYSSLRVRGSDATRVNVTINGIPYNDAESHNTFWVNMPDLASSVENIQLQRGVGTSTNGSGAFGASLNILTDTQDDKPSGQLSFSKGSYNTQRNSVKFNSGTFLKNFSLSGRGSSLKSDGYIDRAWVDMKSLYLQGDYNDEHRNIKAVSILGNQATYQAWNGLEDPEKLANDRTYNTAGEMYDKDGNLMGFYKNETDNYKQNQYQLHWSERLSEVWKTNIALFYTQGKGYYENYKNNQDLADYSIADPIIESSSIIRQKWLENQFYGSVFSVHFNKNYWNVILGGGYSRYQGKHFGKVVWAEEIPNFTPHEYYYDKGYKDDLNVYWKTNYQFSANWNAFVDLQWRNVEYRVNGYETGIVDDTFNFFNPKLGVTYTINPNQNLYFSYAKANREPNRDDYENGNPKPESLDDFELGWRFAQENIKLNVNGFYMRYKNQLVLTGALNDVGAPIRANSGDSYRLGIEVDALAQLGKFTLRPNIAYSQNKNLNFKAHRDGAIQHLGNTDIAFSPELIIGNALSYSPLKDLHLTVLNKYVSEQYMSNLELESSRLKSYFVNDLNLSYTIRPEKVITQIHLSLLVNNIFNYKYISNGYFYSYDDSWSHPSEVTTIDGAGYYPQATRNILFGVSIDF